MTRGKAPYSCSVCGKMRDNDVNRWWCCRIGIYEAGPKTAFVCTPWHEGNAATEGTEHACGETCSLALFSRYLATGSLAAPVSIETAKGSDEYESSPVPEERAKEQVRPRTFPY